MKKRVFLGVLLATAVSSRADIVYSGPKSITLSSGSYQLSDWVNYQTASGTPFQIDFDSDGAFDLDLYYAPGPGAVVLGAAEINGGAIAGMPWVYAAAFAKGEKIGDALPVMRGSWTTGSTAPQVLSSPIFSGGFLATDAFLGIQLISEGHIHYGWVEIDGSSDGASARVLGWAYEKDAGVSINAGTRDTGTPVPEPSTFAIGSLVFLGAVAIRKHLRSLNR